MTLADKFHHRPTSPPIHPRPVWHGPERDGITFSLLSRFLCCRERFRLLVIEGLRPHDRFNHKIEFGSMWHVCEEAYGRGVPWDNDLSCYAHCLAKKYPMAQQDVDHWYMVCQATFPIYLDYWSKHQDVVDRRVLLPETVFDVPYTIPSGRIVRLRGKWDSVDLIGRGKAAGLYLQENKTKGDINPESIQSQLASGFDLQTMMYLVALDTDYNSKSGRSWQVGESIIRGQPGHTIPICGVRYNVIRRPLSGGTGTIRQKKDESTPSFYQRLAGIIRDNPDYYFMRWKVDIGPSDIAKFRQQCLDPILEQLCDWWEWLSGCDNYIGGLWGCNALRNSVHYRYPYGIYNPMNEGGYSELDAYLESGSEAGLARVDNLFPELGDHT